MVAVHLAAWRHRLADSLAGYICADWLSEALAHASIQVGRLGEAPGSESEGPMISFIMPAKNAGKYITAAIEALAKHRSEAWELIVVEDHSDDNTFEVVSGFNKKDDRIKVFKNKGFGKIAGLNYGYSLTTGDKIKCIDADDILDLNYFNFEAINHSDAMCHDACITSSVMKEICKYTVNRKALDGSFEECLEKLVSLPRWTWSFNRALADKIFPMPAELPFEDVWFSLIIKRFAKNINYVSENLYYYRQHETQTYAGILNFDKEAVVFRSKRMLRFIEVLEKHRNRFSLEGWGDADYLHTSREYYSLLGSERIGFRTVLTSSLPPGLKARVLVSRKLNGLAPLLLKMKWAFQR